MHPSVVASITQLAATQHGAISVTQLRELGITIRRQQAAVASGWLLLVAPGVTVVAGTPDTWHRRLQVGLLSVRTEAWVSHEAAARLHGLDRSIEDAVEFSVPRTARGRMRSGKVHTTDAVGPLDVVTVEGFRCSAATRTIIDLAHAGISTVRLEAAIDSAVRSGLTAPRVLERRLDELRGTRHRGIRVLDRLLVDSGGESLLERRFLELIRRAGLPRPDTQAIQRRDGQRVARVDFYFRDEHVVVEVTGRLGHSTPTERGRDAHRRNELTDIGLTVYEYTWAHVTERPSWVASTLRDRLARASMSRDST